MQRYRVERVQRQLELHDLDAVLLYDPVNIRYVTDTTNMSIWTMHNQVRYVLVTVDGRVVLFEFGDADFLGRHADVVSEIRPATAFIHPCAGARAEELSRQWGSELCELLKETATSWPPRLGVDMLELHGVAALHDLEVVLTSGDPVLQQARCVKSVDELDAMRCAIVACELSLEELADAFHPGVTEMELWTTLQAANHRRYGEWGETRLLCSGSRTSPWYQEASRRTVCAGDIMTFDTDLIGAFGMCVDISRSWVCDAVPTAEQDTLHSIARHQLESNIGLHGPGASFREISEHAWHPPSDEYYGYALVSHGVGLCDEYPCIYHRETAAATGYDGQLEPGMTLCVEAYVGSRQGGEGVKLEEQILITPTGNERLTTYPLELVPRP